MKAKVIIEHGERKLWVLLGYVFYFILIFGCIGFTYRYVTSFADREFITAFMYLGAIVYHIIFALKTKVLLDEILKEK